MDYQGPLFKSTELGKYQLLKEFPASGAAISLPDEIIELLRNGRSIEPYIGAYPPEEGL